MPHEEIKKLEELNKTMPDNARVLLALGKAYLADCKLYKAQEKLELSLELDSDNPETYLKLGNVMTELKDIDIAVSCYQKALVLDPYYVEALYCLGLVQVELGNTDETEKIIARLEQLHPMWAKGLTNFYEKSKETTK